MKNNSEIPYHNNMKGLVQDLTEKLDLCMSVLLENSPYKDVRPADVKSFMLISRNPRTISGLARALNISRQAAFSSVSRLIELGVIELKPAPGSKRDKIPVVTKKGNEARRVAEKNLKIIDSRLQTKIGEKRFKDFRQTLIDLLQD